MAKQIATLNVYGDKLKVEWTGSVWEAPCNGTQHARVKDAMRQELERYLSDCGEDVDEMADEIASLIENIERSCDYEVVELPDGSWIVRNNETWSKTHDGYFGTQEEAKAELDSILSCDE